MKRPSRKVLIIIGIAVALLIVAGVAIAQKKREKPIPITTDKAFRKTITQLVTATGKIQPEIEVPIAPEVSGEIIEIPVKEGQFVHKGDLLLKIRPDVYQAQVEAQQAALDGARAAIVQQRSALDKARLEYQRAQNLFNQNLLSDSDRKSAQTSYEMAQAQLNTSQFQARQAEGGLRQIRDALTKTAIFAPSDGTITTLPARVGQRVVGTIQFAGTEVMRIADLTHMEAQVDVNENDIVNVRRGDTARINVDAYPDHAIAGVVREIASSATTQNAGSQEQVTNFQVKISIPNPPIALHPGMSATADIETATVQNAVVVPIQSVTVRQADSKLSPEEMEKKADAQKAQDSGDNKAETENIASEKRKQRELREKLQRVVFVKSGDTVKMRRVETGIADNTYIEIKSGLKPGEEVVSGSYTAISRKLKDGSKVQMEKQGQTG